MTLIGFGCSFTYGSELVDPDIDENNPHYSNLRYRESNVWLGLLAKRLGCTFDNRAEPANSNFAIGHQVAEFVRKNHEHLGTSTICIGWTERTRMSWYDDHWTHNGFVSDETGWTASCREWVTRHTSESLDMYTENAKLLANSACKFYGVNLIQFNALGRHNLQGYPNYLADGGTMDGYLKSKQIEFEKNYFASGGHPNEQGHEVWATFLYDWIESKSLV